MHPYAVPSLNFAHFCSLAPEIVLAVWGMVVLLVDVGWLRRQSSAQRRQIGGWLTLAGVFAALVTALLALLIQFNAYGLQDRLPPALDYLREIDPALFHGTIADDLLTKLFNLLFIVMLALVVRMSMAWSFTESWGEYFALLLWSTVGMMLLTASEELLTLFLTLEMMTICLYLCTAFEKDKRRSAEAGLKYFVYGSVSSALFLFGLSLLYGLTGSTGFDAIQQALLPLKGGTRFTGLEGNVAGATALLLMLVGFGFKVAAVPFHQWAPDAYEGAPAPVTAWIATGSKVASFVALMKVLLHALGGWASYAHNPSTPGWIGIIAALAAASMTFGNLAALAQRNLKRMLAYSSIAHAGYMLVGVAAAGVSTRREESAGSVLYYLVVYAFSNLGAFAVAAWLARDKGSDDIDDLNGIGFQHPGLAVCILLLMLSLIGMPPLAGFFGKLYMFMEALNEPSEGRLTLVWLVFLGLLNSVISAFYYVRVLKAMFLRDPSKMTGTFAPAGAPIAAPIVLSTLLVLGFGLYPEPLVDTLKGAATQMLSSSGTMSSFGTEIDRAPHAGPPVDPNAPQPEVFPPTGSPLAPKKKAATPKKEAASKKKAATSKDAPAPQP